MPPAAARSTAWCAQASPKLGVIHRPPTHAPNACTATSVPAYYRSTGRQSSRRTPGARESSRTGSGVACAGFAARQAPHLSARLEKDAAEVDGKPRCNKTRQDLLLDRCAGLKGDPQLGTALSLDAFLDPLETPQHEQGERHRSETQAELAAAKAQAHHGDEPQRCRCGDALNEVVAPHNSTGANEPHPR